MELCFNCTQRLGKTIIVVRVHQGRRHRVAVLCGHCWVHTFMQPGAQGRLIRLFIDDARRSKPPRAQPGKGGTLGSEVS